MTNLEAVKELFEALGGSSGVIALAETTADAVASIADIVKIRDVTVEPEEQSKSFWGTAVSEMQAANINIQGSTITGTLKYVATGALVDDWHVHHFIALKFIDSNEASDIKVGLKNLVSLDEDMNAVLAIESNKQLLRIKSYVNGVDRTQVLSLSGLTLEEP